MRGSIRMRPRTLVLASALGVGGCGGDDGPTATPCEPGMGNCACEATGAQCPGDTSTASGSPGTSGTSGTTAAIDSGSDGDATTGAALPPFSVLPPLDVLGARWVYAIDQDGEEPYESVCEVIETFTWPDGTPGSTLSCSSNGGATSRETRFALYADRQERRDVIDYDEYDPPAPLYRVPLEVGDAWEVSWSHTFVVTTELSEAWTVRSAGPIELPAGTFDAIELGLVLTVDGEPTEATVWWADGVGRIASEDAAIRTELVELHVP